MFILLARRHESVKEWCAWGPGIPGPISPRTDPLADKYVEIIKLNEFVGAAIGLHGVNGSAYRSMEMRIRTYDIRDIQHQLNGSYPAHAGKLEESFYTPGFEYSLDLISISA